MYEPWLPRKYPPAWRLVLGFVVAPSVAAFVMAVAAPAYEGLPDIVDFIWRTTKIFALFGAYPTAVFVGVPAYFMLRRHFRPTLDSCAVAGSLIAAFPWVVLGLLPSGATQASIDNRATVVNGWRTAYGWTMQAELTLEIAACGVLGGLVFWLVVVAGWRRIDDADPIAS